MHAWWKTNLAWSPDFDATLLEHHLWRRVKPMPRGRDIAETYLSPVSKPSNNSWYGE
jgi:hypothetical protein